MKKRSHTENCERSFLTASLDKKNVLHPNEDIGQPSGFLQYWELFWKIRKLMQVPSGDV